ncbi:hypothetical protein A5845_002196, partial [Enterococcus faecium]
YTCPCCRWFINGITKLFNSCWTFWTKIN